MQLAQSRNVFLSDFVEDVNRIRGFVHKLFLTSDSAYRGNQFYLFNQLMNFNHEVIHMCWSQDFK